MRSVCLAFACASCASVPVEESAARVTTPVCEAPAVPTASAPAACAPTASAAPASAPSASSDVIVASSSTTASSPSINQRVAVVARRFLVDKPPLRRPDCSGLVIDVLRAVGVQRNGGARLMWDNALAEHRVARDRIRPGDLVFFDRTWDSNGNGRVDDTLTHVAVVVAVEPDGTVVMVHRSSTQIEELRMSLAQPHVHAVKGVVVNSYLRSPRYGTASSPRLSAELYHGHARPPAH